MNISASGYKILWKYMSTKWDTETITQTETKQKTFETLITTLSVGSDPGLPDVSKPFHLLVH